MKKITLLICAFICVLSPLFGQEYDVYAEEENNALNARKTAQPKTQADQGGYDLHYGRNIRYSTAFYDGKEISKAELEYKMKTQCPAAYEVYVKGKTKTAWSWACWGGSAALILMSFCTEDDSAKWGLLGSGAAFLVPSIILTHSAKKDSEKSVEMFNECKKTSAVEFQLKLGGNGAGLAVNF